MSIPIEKRELQDGWVLTCRSKDGGDLRLSDLSVLRENMLLSVFGSDNVFHPLSGSYKYAGTQQKSISLSVSSDLTDDVEGEESVLDEVRQLILSAKMHGAWIAGVGGLKMVRSPTYSSYLADIYSRYSHSSFLCLLLVTPG